MEFWLATMNGFCRLLARSDATDGGIVAPMYRWGSMAVFDQETFAYLTMREVAVGGDGSRTFELGVCAYGPHGGHLAERVAGQIRRWDRNGRSLTNTWIEIHPAAATSGIEGQLVAEKRHTRIIVRTASAG